MKKLLFLLVAGALTLPTASAQITYLTDTALITDVGYEGAPASCRAYHDRYFGFDMNRAHDQWSADVFTVPAGSTWKFDTVILYASQYGSGTSSTFLNCNLQIYNGTPGLGGSVIWGDTVTNVLAATGFTGIYKVDTLTAHGGLLSNSNPIMYLKLYLSPAPVLSAGTYWLSWSAACSGGNSPFSVDKVLPGRINPSGQMGRGLYSGTWGYDTDSGNVAGFNMIIKASASVAAVPIIGTDPILLKQNVPNPFSRSCVISFNLQQTGYAKLSVYNIVGQLVATLIDGQTNAGEHKVTFGAENMPAGIYFYQLNTSTTIERKQMILVK